MKTIKEIANSKIWEKAAWRVIVTGVCMAAAIACFATLSHAKDTLIPETALGIFTKAVAKDFFKPTTDKNNDFNCMVQQNGDIDCLGSYSITTDKEGRGVVEIIFIPSHYPYETQTHFPPSYKDFPH